MTTLCIDWWQLDDGRWVAKCDTHAKWSFQSTDPEVYPPKAEGEKSLKRHHSRHLQFAHFPHFNPVEDGVEAA
jgi:hypothetical protein